MAIPQNKQFRLPMLKFLADNKEHHRSEVFEYLDKEFQFTDEDKAQRLPSGGSRLGSRKVRALADLKAANLLENTARGYYKITEQGQEVLKGNPSIIDQKLLLQYAPADSKFFYPQKKNRIKIDNKKNLDKNNLSNELLQNIKNKDPSFLERLAVKLVLAMGYGYSHEEAGEAIGKSHDGGIDGIIKQDMLGLLDTIYLQAKRYDSRPVGVGEIRDFVGALAAKRAQKGIFITTSRYTKSAREYVPMVRYTIVLIDGNELVDYMIKYNVGVVKDETFGTKKIDSDYFEQ